ncbi:MAG: hypothetical protein H7232_16185 [Aeromicrobium sp.]|nr:hypothetical protein [Burkholderiales bacterium]
MMAATFSRWPASNMGSHALMYGASSLSSVLGALTADLYLAQQQACLPLVAFVAKSKNKPFACDIEDILAESASEPRALIRAVESDYLPRATVVSTMSVVAADYLNDAYPLSALAQPLHNCPCLAERGDLLSPVNRRRAQSPSIYWFGQTLGPHSLAIELIRANAIAGNPFRIVLRGKAQPDYLKQIHQSAAACSAADLVEVLPLVDPSRMVREAAFHDVLFGSQPSQQLFHQLAIGNKVFTGLLAGCAILATDTVAHRQLKQTLPDAILLFDEGPVNSLAKMLAQLVGCEQFLMHMRESAWKAGTARYNWETESQAWCTAIERSVCRL